MLSLHRKKTRPQKPLKANLSKENPRPTKADTQITFKPENSGLLIKTNGRGEHGRGWLSPANLSLTIDHRHQTHASSSRSVGEFDEALLGSLVNTAT